MRLTRAQLGRFEPLANDLSYENLSCDGMLSKSQVDAKRAEIMERWAALEVELGVSVTPQQVERQLIGLL